MATSLAAAPGHRIAAEVRRDIARERWGFLALAAPAVLVMILVLVVPLLWIGGQSFVDREGHIGFSNYVKLFSDGSYVASFWLTVAPGNKSPAICSTVNWSNGRLLFSASITQSRHGHIVRVPSP